MSYILRVDVDYLVPLALPEIEVKPVFAKKTGLAKSKRLTNDHKMWISRLDDKELRTILNVYLCVTVAKVIKVDN